MTTELGAALLGGVLIGISATVMLLMLGRITGISSIFGSVLQRVAGNAWRWCFLVGLVLGPAIFHYFSDVPVPLPSEAGWPMMLIAGLLVGYGTRLGSGCTSGHGVCGIARLSKRSIAGTGMFMATGMLTVFVTRHLLG